MKQAFPSFIHFLFTILFLMLPTLCKAQTQKPNIEIVYVDDLGYFDLSCYGATEVSTPNVDNLAQKGVLFTDGHCPAATSTPSRYSLLTGQYAFRIDASILSGDAIVQMDYITGQLVDHLEKRGLMGNTIIIFSSDNGPVLNDGYSDNSVELLGNHKPAGPYRGNKYSAHEGGTRVPAIVWWPGTIQPKKSNALVTHTDLYASVAELIGHKLSENEALDSYAMWNTFAGKEEKGREFLLQESVTFSLPSGYYQSDAG